jgi:arylsulfatase A-like enzyme
LDLGTILKAIITPQWKYIYNYENKTEQLYDIKADPLERTNLTTKKAKKCRKLKERLFTWNETAKKYPPKKKHIELSPQDKEKLKNLGYID